LDIGVKTKFHEPQEGDNSRGSILQKETAHTFALYLNDLSGLIRLLQVDDVLVVDDMDVVRRMRKVLRLQSSDVCILFDRNCHIVFEVLEQIGKSGVKGLIKQKRSNTVYTPRITYILPL